jgi:hypothetical protein
VCPFIQTEHLLSTPIDVMGMYYVFHVSVLEKVNSVSLNMQESSSRRRNKEQSYLGRQELLKSS